MYQSTKHMRTINLCLARTPLFRASVPYDCKGLRYFKNLRKQTQPSLGPWNQPMSRPLAHKFLCIQLLWVGTILHSLRFNQYVLIDDEYLGSLGIARVFSFCCYCTLLFESMSIYSSVENQGCHSTYYHDCQNVIISSGDGLSSADSKTSVFLVPTDSLYLL